MCELVECLAPATVVLYHEGRPWYICWKHAVLIEASRPRVKRGKGVMPYAE